MTDVDVLIIGAGPVGLALAIELGHRGVPCLVVERNDRVGLSPRAKTTNVRSREHLRRWGIADALRQASPIPPDYPPNVVFATRMNGHALVWFENAFNGKRVRNEWYSEEAQWVPQYTLEEVLRAHAASLPGVRIAFSTELTGFEQDDSFVTATLRPTGGDDVETIRSRYLVGADGARSFVRQAIGAVMAGSRSVTKNYSIIFQSPDLAQRQTLGQAIMYWLVNDAVPAMLGPMDMHGRWFFMATKLPGDVEPADVDPVDLIRRGTGLADLEIEVLSGDPWVAHSLVADVYEKGRVFLAGDACHLHPPFGGFGMNMGIGDAVDLGWKLAATLQGWGGSALLASYRPERAPVHHRTIRDAQINYATLGNQLARPGLEDPGPAGDVVRAAQAELIRASKEREFRTLGLVLGARYDDSPIVVPDGTVPPAEHPTDYVPSACPGGLAPHLWLDDGSSLYDHFGLGFTLLAAAGAANAQAVADAAARQNIPLTILALGDERLPGLYQARYALIRPDQHVAWRGQVLPEDPDRILRWVTGHGRT